MHELKIEKTSTFIGKARIDNSRGSACFELISNCQYGKTQSKNLRRQQK